MPLRRISHSHTGLGPSCYVTRPTASAFSFALSPTKSHPFVICYHSVSRPLLQIFTLVYTAASWDRVGDGRITVSYFTPRGSVLACHISSISIWSRCSVIWTSTRTSFIHFSFARQPFSLWWSVDGASIFNIQFTVQRSYSRYIRRVQDRNVAHDPRAPRFQLLKKRTFIAFKLQTWIL